LYDNSTSYKTDNTRYTVRAQNVQISISQETLLPLSILKNNSSLEVIVLYLKEISGLKFNEIASLLNRDQRTIWVTYANAKKKKIVIDLKNTSHLTLPLNMFTSRTFSILETIVFYLRTSHNLTFNQISDLLGKNYRTVWTVYKRALKKLDNEQ
jgi:DNA-directed RNA polymerase specialized sigma24 family protein